MLSSVNSLLQVKGWQHEHLRETKATARSVLWGAVAGAIALAIVGFKLGRLGDRRVRRNRRDKPSYGGRRRGSHALSVSKVPTSR